MTPSTLDAFMDWEPGLRKAGLAWVLCLLALVVIPVMVLSHITRKLLRRGQ